MKISTRSFCQSFNPLLQRFFSSSPSRLSSRKMMKKWEQINIIQTVTDKLKKVTPVPHCKCINCLLQWLTTVDIHVLTQSSRVYWWVGALRACCDLLNLRSQTHKRLQGNKCFSQFVKVSFPTIFFKIRVWATGVSFGKKCYPLYDKFGITVTWSQVPSLTVWNVDNKKTSLAPSGVFKVVYFLMGYSHCSYSPVVALVP